MSWKTGQTAWAVWHENINGHHLPVVKQVTLQGRVERSKPRAWWCSGMDPHNPNTRTDVLERDLWDTEAKAVKRAIQRCRNRILATLDRMDELQRAL